MTLQVLAQLVAQGILLGGLYSLFSIGLTLTFGVLRVVNFAHGEFLMLAMYATFWLQTMLGWDPYVSLLAVAPLMLLVGVIAHLAVIRPTISAPHVVQVFATAGLSFALQNLALILWTADFRTARTTLLTGNAQLGPVSIGWPNLAGFLASLAITLVLYVALRATYWGKAIRATAQDRESAQLMGINIEAVYLITFALGTMLVGIAGTLLAPIYPVFPTVGLNLVLIAFVVVVLGGMGSMMGAWWGGLAIGLIETLSGFFMGAQAKQAAYFIIFILVLALRPQGLFGQRGAAEMGINT